MKVLKPYPETHCAHTKFDIHGFLKDK